MHTKLPIISFLQNSSFFVAWFLKNSRISFWIRNFMASCLSRHDQMVYSIFSKSCPSRYQVFSNDSKVRESVYQDGVTTNNDHQSFRNPHYSKFGNIFIFLHFLHFFLSFIQNKISSYFEKETEWETIFFCIYFF